MDEELTMTYIQRLEAKLRILLQNLEDGQKMEVRLEEQVVTFYQPPWKCQGGQHDIQNP